MQPAPRSLLVLFVLGFGHLDTPGIAQQVPGLAIAPRELQGRPTNIVLRLSESGVLSINHQVVPWAQLKAQLKAIYSERPEKILFLETNPKNKVEEVRRAVEVAKGEGLKVYALLAAGQSR
ncbi:MAG: hypothetical protein HOP28_01260 [Gemmatimonadales bacterium]|nr:hypothetical protein [Gemmatimonadales bacterium]